MIGPERVVRGLMVVVAALAIGWRVWPRRPDREALLDLRGRLEALLEDQVRSGKLAREDGFIYGVDLGNALFYAARRRPDLYPSLHAIAVELFVTGPGDPSTHGYVTWRRNLEVPPDASGTTEALRIAAGLWEGGTRLDRPDDRALAVTILHGWVRHTTVDQGVWLVRNYFDYGTRAFANDSYLVDYDPDLLDRVARATGDPVLAEAAARSRDTVRAARAPSGLVYPMMQPDVATLMPGFPMPAFAPNDLVQLNATCTVAETVVSTAPDVARGVLDFARARLSDLRLYYRASDGASVAGTRAEVTTLSCLVRVAAGLGDRRARSDLAGLARARWAAFAGWPSEPRLYVTGEALLAVEAALADE